MSYLNSITFRKLAFACAALSMSSPLARAQDAAEPAEKKITFEEHIKPIFREHCTACHSESDKESDLALDTYSATLAGGSSGEVVAEGNSSSSRLFALITHAERPFMPPDQDPISKEQLDLVKTWIDQGMPENSGSKIKRSNNAAAAMLGSVSIGKPEGPPPMPEQVLKQPVLETERSSAISALAASPWSPLIAVGGQFQVTLYHAQTGELLGIIPFPEGEPQSLTFTRDGKQLLIGGGRHSHSGCAVLVDVASGNRISKVGDELDVVLAADISPDKQRIAIAGPQKIVRVFNSVSGELVFEMKKHTDWIFSLRYSPDGVLLASGDRSNGLVVWEADTGRLYTELSGHKDAIRGLDFRADSNVLASASLDGTIKFWDMFENKEVKSWAAHPGGVTSVAFAHNGQVASSGRDAKVKLWNANGELQKEFAGLSESALEVALTGDADKIAGGDWSGAVRLWNAADPAQTQLIAANPPSVEKRLAQANETLAAVQSEFNGLNQAAQTARAQATASQAELAAAQAAAASLSSKLTSSETRIQELTTSVGQFDSTIAELEQKLAAAREQRAQAQNELQLTQQTVVQLKTESEAAAAKVTATLGNHDQLAAAAQQAEQLQKQAAEKLAAAQSAAEQAAADKAALEARAQELQQLAAQTVAKATELDQRLKSTLQETQAQQSEAEKQAQQLDALRKQVAEMQAQVEAAIAAQAQAQTQLDTKQKTAAQLQSELEAAQQAALDAKENLELFNQAYRKPE